MNFEKITSRSNPLIKEAAKLSDKKHREKTGLFAFEGRKLLAEALQLGAPLENIFVTEKALPIISEMDIKCRITLVSDEVYEKMYRLWREEYEKQDGYTAAAFNQGKKKDE